MSEDAERLPGGLVEGVANGGIPSFIDLRSLAREVQASRKLVADLRALLRYEYVTSDLLADMIERAGL